MSFPCAPPADSVHEDRYLQPFPSARLPGRAAKQRRRSSDRALRRAHPPAVGHAGAAAHARALARPPAGGRAGPADAGDGRGRATLARARAHRERRHGRDPRPLAGAVSRLRGLAADEQRGVGAGGDGPGGGKARRARHPGAHQHQRPAARRRRALPGVRAHHQSLRPAGLDASLPAAHGARLCGGRAVGVRDLGGAQLAARVQRRDGAPGVLRDVRPAAEAARHHASLRRHHSLPGRPRRADVGRARHPRRQPAQQGHPRAHGAEVAAADRLLQEVLRRHGPGRLDRRAALRAGVLRPRARGVRQRFSLRAGARIVVPAREPALGGRSGDRRARARRHLFRQRAQAAGQVNYDIIVIGAGHNGLTLACYLAKAGLRTLVLERLPYPGGGVTSREFAPGFTTSLHSVNHNWMHIGPIRQDLRLEEHGSRYVFPSVICSHLFSDGRSLTLHRDLEATAREIARFSTGDAARYRDWIREHTPTFEFIARTTFAPPERLSAVWGRLEETAHGRRVLKTWLMSIEDVAEDLFGDECVKTWFVNYCLQTIQDPFAKGSGLVPVSLLVNQHRSGGNSLSVGGSQSLTTALVACLRAHGGELRTGCHVARILTGAGRANGVVLADGSEIQALRAVASNVEPKQVFQQLVPRDDLPGEFVAQVEKFRFSRFTIFGVHLALEVDPAYRDASANAAGAFNVMLGTDTMDDVRKQFYELSVGRPPEPPGL